MWRKIRECIFQDLKTHLAIVSQSGNQSTGSHPPRYCSPCKWSNPRRCTGKDGSSGGTCGWLDGRTLVAWPAPSPHGCNSWHNAWPKDTKFHCGSHAADTLKSRMLCSMPFWRLAWLASVAGNDRAVDNGGGLRRMGQEQSVTFFIGWACCSWTDWHGLLSGWSDVREVARDDSQSCTGFPTQVCTFLSRQSYSKFVLSSVLCQTPTFWAVVRWRPLELEWRHGSSPTFVFLRVRGPIFRNPTRGWFWSQVGQIDNQYRPSWLSYFVLSVCEGGTTDSQRLLCERGRRDKLSVVAATVYWCSHFIVGVMMVKDCRPLICFWEVTVLAIELWHNLWKTVLDSSTLFVVFPPIPLGLDHSESLDDLQLHGLHVSYV